MAQQREKPGKLHAAMTPRLRVATTLITASKEFPPDDPWRKRLADLARELCAEVAGMEVQR